jgi:uncharacterized protein YjbJ (UPF0337 family)
MGKRNTSASRPAAPNLNHGSINMDDATNIKGRVEEAAGDLTDDEKLQREGKIDQVAGKAKETLSDAVDKVKDKLHKSNDSGGDN